MAKVCALEATKFWYSARLHGNLPTLVSGIEGSTTRSDVVEAALDPDRAGNRGQVGADGAGAVGADGQIIRHPKLVISASGNR